MSRLQQWSVQTFWSSFNHSLGVDPVPIRLSTPILSRLRDLSEGQRSEENNCNAKLSGQQLVQAIQKYGLLPYLIRKDRQDEFCRIYDDQQVLLSNNEEVYGALVGMHHWLTTCLTSHPECRDSRNNGRTQFSLPKRVIDVGSLAAAESDRTDLPTFVKIVEYSDTQNHYIAVSYRWPATRNPASVLQDSTFEQLASGVPTALLPEVFQDAIMIARCLGIRYVWVDSLCILQGPNGDFHSEALRMSDIYRNALFTLSFTDGASLRTVALSMSKTAFVSKLELDKLDDSNFLARLPFDLDNPESIYSWLDRSENFVCRPEGELDTRAWAFQERLLSTRILSLTEKGLFWECQSHTSSDRRPTGILGDFSPNFRDSDDRKLRALILSPQKNNDIDAAKLYTLWRRALHNYSQRELTYESDRIIAFEGINRYMSRCLEDECILGVWRLDGPRSLIWFVEPTAMEDDAPRHLMNRDLAVSAPSWCWASVNIPVSYRLWHPFARFIDRNIEECIPCCTITSLEADQKKEESFDSYTGMLTMSGTLASIQKRDFLASSGFYILLDPRPKSWLPQTDEERNSSVGWDHGPNWYLKAVIEDQFYVFSILKGGYSSTLQATYGFVLRKSANVFQRIGLFVADEAVSTICVNNAEHCNNNNCSLTQEISLYYDDEHDDDGTGISRRNNVVVKNYKTKRCLGLSHQISIW